MQQLSNKSTLVGLLGGTFDPIHYAHINMAKQLLASFPINHIELIPCRNPPHREQPKVSAEDRLEMVRLAIRYEKKLLVNDLEIQRHPGRKTYTIDTVKQVKLQHPKDILFLILGSDSFLQFNQWKSWRNILNHCHLIIVNRPHVPWEHQPWMSNLLKQHQITTIDDLVAGNAHGKILCWSAQPPSPINATSIREKLLQGKGQSDLKELPTSVMEYIKKNRLYEFH